MPFVAVAFGWPAAFISILLGFRGITRGQWAWVLTGALMAFPFLTYLAMSPRCGPLAGAAALSDLGAVAT